jgi:hypothetical protein
LFVLLLLRRRRRRRRRLFGLSFVKIKKWFRERKRNREARNLVLGRINGHGGVYYGGLLHVIFSNK